MHTTTQTAAPVAQVQTESVAVIGIEYAHQVWLYDAAEFRPAGINEVWEFGGNHYKRAQFTMGGRKYNQLSKVDPHFIDAAHRANRYWPGEDVMAQRELDATVDAFLAATR